jgi:hypothetical protein
MITTTRLTAKHHPHHSRRSDIENSTDRSTWNIVSTPKSTSPHVAIPEYLVPGQHQLQWRNNEYEYYSGMINLTSRPLIVV